MSTKTWDVLNRETGEVLLNGDLHGDNPNDWHWHNGFGAGYVGSHEVAYCRETGEVVYL